jgi:hypothetical protein
MRKLLIAGLAVAALALGACGDDDSDDTTTAAEETSSSAPQASGSLDDAVAQLNEAIANQDCEAFVAMTFSFLRADETGEAPAEPGDPVRPDECGDEAPAPPLLADIEGTTFDESEEYGGTAAMSTGSGGKPIQGYEEWTVQWLVDRDGEWRTLGFIPTDPQFEEDLPETVDPVAITQQLVDAVESGDCAGAEEFINADHFLGEPGSSPEEGCESVVGGSIFAPAVSAATDEVAVEELGQSRDFAFVGVDTGDTYFAAILGTPVVKANQPVQDEVQVIDIVPMTEFEIVEQPEDEKQ